MYKMMHIGFGFGGVPKVLDLEPAFNALGGDWLRYATAGWLLWTDKDAATVFWTLQPYLDAQDNVIVAPIVVDDCFGRMPPWVWTWMQQKKAAITTDIPDWTKILGLPKP